MCKRYIRGTTQPLPVSPKSSITLRLLKIRSAQRPPAACGSPLLPPPNHSRRTPKGVSRTGCGAWHGRAPHKLRKIKTLNPKDHMHTKIPRAPKEQPPPSTSSVNTLIIPGNLAGIPQPLIPRNEKIRGDLRNDLIRPDPRYMKDIARGGTGRPWNSWYNALRPRVCEHGKWWVPAGR